MNPDDLVERVARAMMQSEPWSSFWGKADAEKLARAALALALEEAAKVAESCAPATQDTWSTELAERCDMVAAAIRAMIQKEPE